MTITLTEGASQAFEARGGAPPYGWEASGGVISGNGAAAQFVAGSVSGIYSVTLHDGSTPPGMVAAVVTVTAPAAPPPPPSPSPSPTPPPPPAPPAAPTPSPRQFPAAGADWLYSAPTGTPLPLASVTSGLAVMVNTHDGGFDYPVQTTDGSHGCTVFTDTLYWNLSDTFCVPNPAGGFTPSVGAYGANDGHLVVVDTSTGVYYDFWKLTVDSSGNPLSTNVGELHSGTLASSDGLPGTTASDITGLAGVIMPGELDCETCLNHALSLTVPSTLNSPNLGTQAPADKTDGTTAGGVLCEGAKLQFDPALNVDGLTASTAVKAIMKALQEFGGVITDQNGGQVIGMYSSLATAPDLTGINQIAAHLQIYY